MADHDNHHCRVVCDMIGCPDPGLLHPELVGFLNTHAKRIERVNGRFWSRQAIAALLAIWECHNPSERVSSLFIRGEWRSRRVWIDGEELYPGPSQKIRNHSPDGFNWGYGGSGAAQFALALLLHLTDEAFACANYQDFKWKVIATLPPDFELRGGDIYEWIERYLSGMITEQSERSQHEDHND